MVIVTFTPKSAPDHLSPRLLTDSNGSPVDQRGHFPFGETWYETGSTTTPWEFTTYFRDNESANDYALARNYVNRFGRFMTVDPRGDLATDITNPQSWNYYSYVLNNPIIFGDPLGLECVWDDGSYDSEDDPETDLPPQFAQRIIRRLNLPSL